MNTLRETTIERMTLGPLWCVVAGADGSGKTTVALDHLETLAHRGSRRALVLTTCDSYKAWSEGSGYLGKSVQYLDISNGSVDGLPSLEQIEKEARASDITVARVRGEYLDFGDHQLIKNILHTLLEAFRISAESTDSQDSDVMNIVVIDEFNAYACSGVLDQYLSKVAPLWDRSVLQLILVVQEYEDIPENIERALGDVLQKKRIPST